MFQFANKAVKFKFDMWALAVILQIVLDRIFN